MGAIIWVLIAVIAILLLCIKLKTNSFYAIFIDTDDKNENIESFIEWMLSGQGQLLVSKTGYVPIK